MEKISFLDDQGTFVLKNPEEISCLYFPLAGEGGLKSSITPGLGGDCKLDQESFLLEPVSAEDLHTSRSTRNFWCVTEKGCWSATGMSAEQEAARFTAKQDESTLKAGLMWQTAGRTSKKYGLRADITSFVPVRENVEIMHVQIANTGKEPKMVTCVAAIPIYGRSADNIRDHRNVTSMLHRIRTTEQGVLVKPTMSFDEKGHRENHRIYYVLGSWELQSEAGPDICLKTVGEHNSEGESGFAERNGVPELSAAGHEAKNDSSEGKLGSYSAVAFQSHEAGNDSSEAVGRPEAFWPTVESFIGEGGTFLHPRAVYEMTRGAAEKAAESVLREAAKNSPAEMQENVLPEAAGSILPEATKSILSERTKSVPSGTEIDGREAMGGLRFPQVRLAPGQSAEYIVLLGISEDAGEMERVYSAYNTVEKVKKALEETKEYWQKKVNVRYHTGKEDFDRLMRWVSFQPYLRRIYGCSFLPHHDYGRGGRGWRDLWQDCLSLLLMEPGNVRNMILNNFAGTRIDGTNATIIGSGEAEDSEFIADRNGISRVWMDHGVWPFMTTRFYIDQTGDTGILLEKMPYFKDAQAARGTRTDTKWDESQGMRLKTADGQIYEGTVLEHLLLQNLCAFYEVGAHNIIRLRGADWNDALDMASENGESVAFTCAYAGNLRQLAECLRILEKSGIRGRELSGKTESDRPAGQMKESDTCRQKELPGEKEPCGQTETGGGAQKKLSREEEPCYQVELLEEIGILLEEGEDLYADLQKKQELLARYLEMNLHTVSGRKIKVEIGALADNLEAKADWLMRFLRSQEWIDVKPEQILEMEKQIGKKTEQPETVLGLCGQAEAKPDEISESEAQSGAEGWFNSYYDNHGRAVEGITDRGVRMMLTGQVFAIMSGTASEEQIRKICRSADHYLYDAPAGGYRLNTDFHELKFDMGRMFGFAYGEKENGAVFSHMTVMYANALYQRGFVREGYRALQTLADAALDFETSKIYPGIPEYFNNDGRGMYHYLTGAGSWYMMTMITQVFGVRGEAGDLILEPKLVKEQFDESGTAKISLTFAGKEFEVIYHNPRKLDYGEYVIGSVNSRNVLIEDGIICGREKNKPGVKIFCDAAENRADTERKLPQGRHRIFVELAARE